MRDAARRPRAKRVAVACRWDGGAKRAAAAAAASFGLHPGAGASIGGVRAESYAAAGEGTMATPRRSRVPAWPRLLLLPTAARLVLYRGAASRLASPLQSSRLVSSAKPPSTQRRCPESRSRDPEAMLC